MKNPWLSNVLISPSLENHVSRLHQLSLNKTRSSQAVKGNTGYTLIELLIVLLVVGILSTIAAPGWLAFINNQRLRASIDRVYSAMQLAQSSAKRDKLAWQAAFRVSPSTGLVQWTIYSSTSPAPTKESSSSSFTPNVWYSLESDVEIDAATTTLLQPSPGTYTAIFNSQGCVVQNVVDGCSDNPFLFIPKINLKHKQLGSARRCVIVATLLGTLRVGNSQQECI